MKPYFNEIAILMLGVCSVVLSATLVYVATKYEKLKATLKHNNIMRLRLIVDLAVMKEDYETAAMASEMIKQLEGN